MSERTLCIVLHDAAGSTQAACMRTLAAVRDVAGDAPVTLLAVPQYHGEMPAADFEAWLGDRVRRGDELALHGLSHRDDSAPPAGAFDALRRNHYTRGEGEFWALAADEAGARMDTGIAWFARNRWPLAGFVAPAWLMGPGAWAAIAGRPFDYTATLRRLVHLPAQQERSGTSDPVGSAEPPGKRASRSAAPAAVVSQSVVYSTSSGWRRLSSLAWNAAVARFERGNAVLRLELHPRDADFAAVRRSWQKVLERALADRRPTTVAAFMQSTRPAGSAHPPANTSATADADTTWRTTTAD